MRKIPASARSARMNLVPVLKTRHIRRGAPATKEQTANTPAEKKSGDMEGMPGMSGGARGSAHETPKAEFRVPMERQQQIGVTYAMVETKPLNHTIRAVGRVAPDTQRVWRVVARAGGYVQELGVSAPGEVVKKGQVLMTLYSPELLTTQRELIDLLRMRDNPPKGAHSARADAQSLIESAERGCGFGTSPTNRSQRSSRRARPKSRSRFSRRWMASSRRCPSRKA